MIATEPTTTLESRVSNQPKIRPKQLKAERLFRIISPGTEQKFDRDGNPIKQ
jgi:hypothetical protein